MRRREGRQEEVDEMGSRMEDAPAAAVARPLQGSVLLAARGSEHGVRSWSAAGAPGGAAVAAAATSAYSKHRLGRRGVHGRRRFD